MYVIKLNRKPTKNMDVYFKHAIIVSKSFDEYVGIMAGIDRLNARLRRKQVQNVTPITGLIPTDGATWLIYVEYRAREDGDWEEDIKRIVLGQHE